MNTSKLSPPRFWTVDASGVGGTRLTYAVRGGVWHAAILVLGVTLLLGGLYGMYWLSVGGELTVAGYIFLLVPAAVVLSGVYVLDIALLAHTTCLLGRDKFVSSRKSLFGQKSFEIPRASVKAITQQYSPPGPSAPTGATGDWTTFIVYQGKGARKPGEFAVDGLGTPEEARWLGPLLAQWGGVPVQRGFGPAFEEADPAELPDLSDEKAS